MDLNTIDQLIKMVNASALESLEVEQDGLRIKLVNNTSGKSVISTTQPVSIAPSIPQPEAVVAEPAAEIKDDSNCKFITSPIVGVFKSLSSVKKGCIDVGSKVSVGDLVCVVEAMKLINEIESDISGEIVEVLVNDGDQVEFGQNLFKVK